MGLGSVIRVIVTGDTREANKALTDLDKKALGSGSSLEKMGNLGGKVFKGLAVAALAYAGLAVKMGSAQEDEQTKLSTALKDAGTSWGANAKAIAAAEAANTKYGTSNTDVMAMLAQGVTATGSLSKANKELTLAQNIAAESGKPLAAVMTGVIKAGEGNTRVLKQMGIDLPVVSGGAEKVRTSLISLQKAQEAQSVVQEKIKEGYLTGAAAILATKTANDNLALAQQNLTMAQTSGGTILDALSQKFNGQANAAAATFGGQLRALKAQFDNITATVGTKLIPILEHLGSWAMAHKPVFAALAIAIGTVATALMAVYAAQKLKTAYDGVATAATWLYHSAQAAVNLVLGEQATATEADTVAQEGLDVAMDANPMGALVIAIAAVIAGLVEVYTHLSQIEEWLGVKANTHDDSSAIESRNDKRMHWAPGTTARMNSEIGTHGANAPGTAGYAAQQKKLHVETYLGDMQVIQEKAKAAHAKQVAEWDASVAKNAATAKPKPVTIAGGVSLPPSPSIAAAIKRWDDAVAKNAKAAAKKIELAERLLEEQVRAHNKADARANAQRRLAGEKGYLDNMAVITHVHMGVVQTPKQLQAAMHRHAKRNGRSNVLPAVGARAPDGFSVSA